MKKQIKRSILAVAFCAASVFSAHALPGFKPYIQELPGQYVYYRDMTFERESYTGLLMFDEKTFAARYFAPQDAKAKQPEVNVEIYFSIDPAADHLELTGERIMSGFTPEEAEFVNYLHDVLYEFSARRIKQGYLSENKKSVRSSEYYGQFGGFVTVEYDAIVPLFNVRQIFSDESKPELYIVTAGQLTSATDRSFEQFKGFPQKNDDKRHSLKLKKSPQKAFAAPDEKTAMLDDNWTQTMDNVFMLGDAALVSVSAIPYAPVDFLIRQLMLSTGDSYLNWQTAEVMEKDGAVSISGLFYQPSTKNVSRNFKMARKNDSSYDFFTLTVYNNIYEKNRAYFTRLLSANSL